MYNKETLGIPVKPRDLIGKVGRSNMLSKNLMICIGLCLILCFSPIDAAEKAITNASKTTVETSGPSMYAKVGPDLKVTSVKVTSAPFVVDTAVLMPLQITIKNVGSVGVTKDFYLGAFGFATDGNVQGFYFGAAGEVLENNFIVVNGLAAGAQKTVNGILMLKPAPEPNPPFQPGSKYKVEGMVDLNMDPDFSGAIAETNETNNRLEIDYPWAVPAGGGMMQKSPATP